MAKRIKMSISVKKRINTELPFAKGITVYEAPASGDVGASIFNITPNS